MPARAGLRHACDAAGLGYEQGAGQPVPRVSLGLKPGIQPTGRDPRELQGPGARVTEEPGGVEYGVGALADAGCDEAVLAEEDRDVRLGERPRRPQVRGLAVDGRAPAARRGVDLAERIDHRRRRGPVLVLERDRAAPAAG